MTKPARVRAAELRGRSWLNTGGRDLSLADLRGRVAIIDFWTFCCINCLHVLDELRPLEEKYGDALVIIGVHSPKFEHERDPQALAAAVERYGVEHPVLDDPNLTTWDAFAARAWPTLVVIDPAGYVVSTMAGEGHLEALDAIVGELVAEHTADGTLDTAGSLYVAAPPAETALRFPGKAIELPGGDVLVTDSARHRLVRLAPDLETVVSVIGTGERGRADGTEAQFNEPQGLALLPAEVAAEAGYDLVVADTVNHLLRGVRLADGHVTTVAGTGKQWRMDNGTADALEVDLSSPWDLAWFEGELIIAMAGIHQLWSFDPLARTAGVYAGTTVESLKDGPLDQVWMAQPSGLAATADRLWLVDSETSALRYVERGAMHTAVGQGLFDFGHVDGPAADALMQHPLGLAVLPDGRVAVADTYNGALRAYDPSTETVATLAADLAEPSDVIVLGGKVVVVESAAHRLTAPDLGEAAVSGQHHRVTRKRTKVAPGALRLEVLFEPAAGQKLDYTFGSPIQVTISADPPQLLAEGAGKGEELGRDLVLADGIEKGVLQVVAQAATCDAEAEHPACHLTRQDWGVPIEIAEDGVSTLRLVLRA
ncbi:MULTISPECIES: NHL domain-containing thioredoxin family protein [Glycomyces]|uniref:Redoxin domain-containing protein n=1 Tax=Glycomyces lechevalierae TaxID=256034 RepID=A0A9X3PNJ5_9ACTN|nr:NHL domain-containing thioredoxin family protein [Glycomyces lechevalierae]MDA1386302.1 redoxin domain-containing protein [Glycomyces lechevalierae]MDA1388013.1 redoxin domain-containing protein [Glycomyces lechevalierae]MDR7338816.1 thiol-disulfide isomerase/thioredoxin [Glycomyces lechevalierae]